MAIELTDYLHSLARRLHLEPGESQDIMLELEGHLEDKAAELESQGMDREAALQVAMRGMGAPELVASGMYKVHSPGVWRDVLLATVPHFLLAALFALHLWSHYFLVTLLLIGIALVTWRNWRAGNPSKWSYSWMGYTLAAPTLSWLLALITLGYGGWTLVTTGQLPFNIILFVLLIGYVPFSMWIVFGVVRKMIRRDWLLASLTALPFPVFDLLGPFPRLAGRAVDRSRGTHAKHRHRPGVYFPWVGGDHGRIPQGRAALGTDRSVDLNDSSISDNNGGVPPGFFERPRRINDDSGFGGFPAQPRDAGFATKPPRLSAIGPRGRQ